MSNEFGNEDVEAEDIEHDQYLVFSCNNQEFGFPAISVREISSVLETTPVPNTPNYVEGVVNLQGKLASVINFRKKFGFPDKEIDEDTILIIVEHEGYPIGILVDSVQEVMKIPDQKVQPLSRSTTTSFSKEFITGVGFFGNRLIILMDIEVILSNIDLISADDMDLTIHKIPDIKTCENGF